MATAIAAHMSTEETTHTPQGDGNYQQLLHLHYKSRDNLYPARGRKQSSVHDRHATLEETTHAPQGDGKPFVFTLQKLLEKPFTPPTGDN